MGLKEIYYGFEDKWYEILDSLNHSVPVYKVIEPVDKIVPSFLLFLVIIAGILFMLLGGFVFPGNYTVQISVADASGNAIELADIVIDGENGYKELQTDEWGKTEEFQLKEGIYTIVASKTGFKEQEKQIEIKANNKGEVIVLEESDIGKYTLSFKEADGTPVQGRIDLSFECSNSNIDPPQSMTVFTNIVKIEEPENCGLIVTAITENARQTFNLNPAIKTKSIKFEAADTKVQLTVKIRYEDKGVEGLIKIYDNDMQIERDYTYTGTSIFEIEPGTYKVVFENPDYERTTENITISIDKVVELETMPNPVGTIELEFVDSSSGDTIEGSIYACLKLDEEIVGEDETTNGTLEFGIYEDTEYDLVVDAEDYCIKYVKELEKGTTIIKLTAYDGDCGGTLKVKVIDEDRNPVSNARVGLYDKDGIKIGVKDVTTDINGTAEFDNILSGTYKAFSTKGFSYGWSTAELFSQRTPDKTKLIVSMETKKGNLNVNIEDIEGNPIQFAHIAFVDNFNELVGGGAKVVEGTSYSLETQADKSVAAIVTKEDYADFISYPELIVPGEGKTIDAIMEKPTITGDLKIELIGVYSGKETVSSLAPGEEYELLFKIDIPKTKTYDLVGAHIRVGDMIRSDLDELEIVELQAPGKYSLKKGSSFDSENLGNEELVTGNSKWMSFEWNMHTGQQQFKRGNIYFKVKIKVKETAELNQDLELNYRAWGTDSDIAKDPEDNLNDDYEPSLYSKTYTKKLAVGGETVCADDFCFSSTIVDLEENLGQSVSDSYNAENYKDYSMSFNILNASNKNYANAEIKIISDNIKFSDYSIYGGTNQGITGNLGDRETNWIDIGDLTKNQTINAIMEFLTEQEGGNQIQIKIRSLQKIVFEKTISINVSAQKEMSITIEPEFLASGKETLLEITLKDNAIETDSAVVYIRDKYDNIIADGVTNSMGYLELEVPAQQPGEKLIIEARKPEYKTLIKEIEVDNKVLEAPSNIGISINTVMEKEGEKIFTLTNKTIPLTINEFRIEDADKRIIDIEKMEQWLNASYAGQEIEDYIDIVFKAYPKNIQEPSSTKGNLIVVLESDTITWEQEIPFTVSLTFGSGVDNPSCLVINKQLIEFTTEGQPITLEYELRNDCTINDTPIPLKNLSAKVNWEVNELGTITADSGASYNLSTYYQKLLPELEAGETRSVIITFTPYAGLTGVGEAELDFKAFNPTDNGNEELLASTDLSIKVANLKDCIVVDKPILYILPEKQDTFTIEARGCSADLEFEVDGIELDRTTATLGENESITVNVYAGKAIPGQYNIKINGKTYAETEERYLQEVKARILHECLELSRYEYNIYDDPNKENDGYQDAYLENVCYQKEVTANLYWKEKESLDIGKILLGGAAAYIGYDLSNEFRDNGKDSAIISGVKSLFGSDDDKKELNNPNNYNIVYPSTEPANNGTTNNTSGGGTSGTTSSGGLPGSTIGQGITVNDGTTSSSTTTTNSSPSFPPGTSEPINNASGVTGPTLPGTGEFSLAETSTGNFSLWPAVAMAGIELLNGIINPDYDEGSQSVNKVVIDSEIQDIILYDGEGKSSDITVEKLNVQSLTNKTERKYKNQEMELRFRNADSIVQSDLAEPFVRILSVIGKTYEYETDYKTSGITDIPTLEPKKAETFNQKFQLIFNSINPYEEKQDTQPIPNCVLGGKVGLTGPKAVPRLKYSWSWDNSVISEDTCDTIDNYIYCDATQFTIQTIKKLRAINSFLQEHQANFSCPIEGGSAVSEQDIRTTAKDIALTRVTAIPDWNGTEIQLTIESNNNQESIITVLYQITGDTTRSFERTYSVLSKETYTEFIEEMQDGEYEIQITITGTELCSNCLDEDTANNSIGIEIKKAGTGTRDCTRTMDNLYLFLDQAETEGKASWTNAEKEEVLEYINTLSHLMQDAYNSDFINDFDKYSKESSFFDTPDYYRNEGYDKLLKEIEWDYVGNPSSITAGIYQAKIEIEFGDSWDMFYNNEPVVKPVIELQQLDTPQPDNPFYYLPLDGTIGLDSENGRQGYGVNFKQESIEPVLFNSQQHDLPSIYRTGRGDYQAVMSYNDPESNPITNGWVSIEKNESFAEQNVQERGIILDITKSNGIDIKFSPSYATPVLLDLEYSQGTKAYALYSVEVDNTPQTTTSSLLKWNGVGANCKDFEDYSMLEYWRETSDKHAVANNLRCAPSQGITDYGIEWCSPKRTGNVYLQTVVFTPQSSRSELYLKASNGKAVLTSGISNSANSNGDAVPLNGISRIPYNYINSNIESIDQVFDLVENNFVCVVGSGSNSKFYWNPKMVLDIVYNERLQAENTCIQD